MAVTDRNIVITPNRTAVGNVQPKIVFTGADSDIGDSSAITLSANPENSGTLSFSGTAGQLFSITNNLTGTIFSVNDISGIPSLSINDQGVIQLAEFNGRVIIGDSVGSDDSVSSLQISGAVTADSASFSKTTITNSGTIGTLSSNVDANAYFKITDGTNTIGFDGNEITQATSGAPGNLFLAASQVVMRPGDDNAAFIANFRADGATDLYHNQIKKFETTDSGVAVTGQLTADSATLTNLTISGGTSSLRFTGTSVQDVLKLNNNSIVGVNKLVFNDPGVFEGLSFNGGNTEIFESPNHLSNAAGNLQVTHSSTRRFTVSDSGAEVVGHLQSDSATLTNLNFPNDGKAKFGPVAGGGGLSITHTGSFGFVDTNFVQIRNNGGTKVAAQFFPTAAQKLNHDGNTKFETTDSGINVFGNIRINNNPFPASVIATGTIDSARFPAALPAVSGANLTNLPDAGDGGIAMAIALG